METELGKILDPIADKLLIFFIIIALIIKADFPLWFAVIIFLRDFVILLASCIIFKGKHKIKPSILVGKITFGLLSVLTFIYIIDLSPDFDLLLMKRFFIALCFTFLLWSWYSYYNVYKEEKQRRGRDSQ
jgi:phosphatidylglycerophosphate synthase